MTQQINLLSLPSRRRRSFANPAMLMTGGVVLAALLAAAVALHERKELRNAQTRAAATAQTLKDLESVHERLQADKAVKTAGVQDDAALAKLRAQLKNREDIIAALRSGAVGSTDGFSSYMEALSRQSMDGVWLIGFDISHGGTQIILSGRALHASLVPEYLSGLRREPSLAGREFASMLLNEQTRSNRAADANDAAAAKRNEVRYVQFTVSSGNAAEGPPLRPPPAELLPSTSVVGAGKPKEGQP